MRTLLKTAAVLGLFAPALAFAAYNDVSLNSGTVLSVGGVTINISGSTAVIESITVNDSDFSFSAQQNSEILLSTPDRKVLATSNATFVTVDSCDANGGLLKFTVTEAATITITPSSSTCGSKATSAQGSSSGGNGAPVSSGGGGGGGSSALTVIPASTPASPASTPASGLSTTQVDAILTLLSSFGADQATIDNVKAALNGNATTGTVTAAFARNLELGMTGADVKALQQWLNANGYRVASSGPGSPGNETSKFGGATKAALIKFQKANGITPAAGYFGPKTRAAVK